MRTDEFIQAIDTLTPGEALRTRILNLNPRSGRTRLEQPGRLLAVLGAAAVVCACAVIAVAAMGRGGAPGVGEGVTGAAGTLSGMPASQSGAEATESAAVSIPKDIINFLILGTDLDAVRLQAGMTGSTDCIMLACVNTKTKTLSLISIPRDTYVMLYDENNTPMKRDRINAAYKAGGGLQKQGIEYAVNTVRQYLGGAVPIDYYALFDMDLAKELIDAAGGVTVDVDISADLGDVRLTPGRKKLSGAAALAYARDRHHTEDGDIGRVGHQRQILIALLKELQNKKDITAKIPELCEAFPGRITTNLDSLEDIMSLAFVAKDIDADAVKQYTIDGTFQTADGMSVIVSDPGKKEEIIHEVFGVDIASPGD